MLSSTPLPDYKNPPLNEVVLSAQFLPIEGFTCAHFGLVWQKIRDEFPIVEQHPPVAHQVERFGILGNPNAGLRLELLELPPSPRLLFVSIDKQEVVQIQEDRLMHNWRAQSGEDVYPRYKNLRPCFQKQLQSFLEFLREEKLESPVFDQCEITYVSTISTSDEKLEPSKIMSIWPNPSQAEWLKEPEFTRLIQQFVIPDSEGSPSGRLYIDCHPGVRIIDGKPVLKLSITARLHPVGQDLSLILESLDLGHEWIVKSFAAITTSAIKTFWNE